MHTSHNFYDCITSQIIVNIAKYTYKYICKYLYFKYAFFGFGNSSNNSEQKIDTSLFVKKPYLRSNYIESDVEENIDMKNQY